jgi:hypothetical protein
MSKEALLLIPNLRQARQIVAAEVRNAGHTQITFIENNLVAAGSSNRSQVAIATFGLIP